MSDLEESVDDTIVQQASVQSLNLDLKIHEGDFV